MSSASGTRGRRDRLKPVGAVEKVAGTAWQAARPKETHPGPETRYRCVKSCIFSGGAGASMPETQGRHPKRGCEASLLHDNATPRILSTARFAIRDARVAFTSAAFRF